VLRRKEENVQKGANRKLVRKYLEMGHNRKDSLYLGEI
jgi:hypothetical protein